MAIVPSIDSSLTDTNSSPGFDTTTNTYNIDVISYGNGDNKALIAIEVIFSLLVLVIVVFCFFAGLKKRRRLRQERTERMIENATTVMNQREPVGPLLHGNSTGTVTTLLQLPPPSYSPPDPTTQLSGEAVSRLDRLLVNQICTPPNGVTLPKYTDLYRANS